jgi:hypothetical protein
MPGASQGPAPVMRVFGITTEGNSGGAHSLFSHFLIQEKCLTYFVACI